MSKPDTFRPPYGIGFTGTQKGLTDLQRKALRYTILAAIEGLKENDVWSLEFHHGDCIGGDAEFDQICISHALSRVIHPPSLNAKRAFCAGPDGVLPRFGPGVSVRPPSDYLKRNHDIVDECVHMLACPGEDTEQVRSGTWATVRYARKMRRNLQIILPSGVVLLERHSV